MKHAYGFSLELLTFIQAIYPTKSKESKSTFCSINIDGNVESGISQGPISGLPFFNIFICDLFFDDINMDFANYADGTTPYAYDFKLGTVIESLEKTFNKLFHWFSDNFLKTNPDKCYLPINIDEKFALRIKNDNITNSSNEKLLGILFNKKFEFDERVTSLCRKGISY